MVSTVLRLMRESIKSVSAEIARQNGHVVSYEAQTVGEGETIVYRVSILVRALNTEKESAIIRYIQQMSDIMVEKIDWLNKNGDKYAMSKIKTPRSIFSPVFLMISS